MPAAYENKLHLLIVINTDNCQKDPVKKVCLKVGIKIIVAIEAHAGLWLL